MADRKKTKLSLKRKTISNKSSLFNSIGQRQESLQSGVNDKDPETVIVNLSSDSEPDADTFYQNLQPSKRPRFSEEPPHSGDRGHKAKPIQLKPERLPSETSKRSKFLDVDDDLCKLRMMFLKMQKPRVNIRTLSDLPVTNTQVLCNVHTSESVKHADKESKELSQESKELSPLPPMCKWCLRRKPADYSNLFTDMIQQELQASMADRSVGEHHRALQPPVKGDNSSCTKSMEKGWKSVQIGSTIEGKQEASTQARKTNFSSEEISFPKSNIKLTSMLDNPALTEERRKQGSEIQTVHSQKCYMPQENKISSFGKQTENENMLDIDKIQTGKVKTQSGNTVTQPGNTVTQPGNTVTQPGNTVTQPGNTVTQPGNTVTQPGNTMTQPGNIKTKSGNTMTQPGNTMTQPGNIKTQTGNIKTKSGNTMTQPGNTMTQPGNIKTQTGNIKTKSGNTMTQPQTHPIIKTQKEEHFSPSPYRKVVESVERTNSNKQDTGTKDDKIGPKPRQMDRKNTNNSLQPLVTVQTIPPTNSVCFGPKHTDSTENKPAFPDRSTGNLDTGKSEAPKQELESPDVQCCPLCQIAFDKSATQMDIDGHIAVCLSMSGDDVTW